MTYLLTWIARITPVPLFLVGLVFQQPALTSGAFAVVFVSLIWPRCKNCGLPTFWQRRPKDPDHFCVLRRQSTVLAAKDCSRCGHDLTT